eukprot:scaffold45989_cov71-Cyclotella_meneghiniana.AAC.3
MRRRTFQMMRMKKSNNPLDDSSAALRISTDLLTIPSTEVDEGIYTWELPSPRVWLSLGSGICNTISVPVTLHLQWLGTLNSKKSHYINLGVFVRKTFIIFGNVALLDV